MILIDVVVPSVGNTYDFKIDEDTKASLIIDEIAEMICQKEQCKLDGNLYELVLYAADSRGIINRNSTLWECGVRSGDKLLLL